MNKNWSLFAPRTKRKSQLPSSNLSGLALATGSSVSESTRKHRRLAPCRSLTETIPSSRRAFTLIELMVVIVILGILAGIVVGALRGAQQDTLAAKTRGTITKIDAILNERFDEYLTKSITYVPPPGPSGAFVLVQNFPVENPKKRPLYERAGDSNWPVVPGRGSPFSSPRVPPMGLLRERVRIAAIRDMMRMEMPDRIGDLCVGVLPTGALNANPPVHVSTGFVVGGFPVLMQVQPPAEFLRIISRINSSLHFTKNEYLNEELLFMIVEGTFIGGVSAMESFGASEIADTDGDGLQEFVDAWGKPIRWLRWPAGVNSISPMNPDPLIGASATDPYDPTFADDGFDPANDLPTTGTGIYPFRPGDGLRPMVVSAGSDGRFGIRFYWTQDYQLPSGGSFTRAPMFSPSNVRWPIAPVITTSPSAPLYFPVTLNCHCPDPYHPRIDLTAGVNPSKFRLGGVLTSAVDQIALGEIIGVNPSTGAFIYDTTLSLSDSLTLKHSQDNVSNLDESGAAP